MRNVHHHHIRERKIRRRKKRGQIVTLYIYGENMHFLFFSFSFVRLWFTARSVARGARQCEHVKGLSRNNKKENISQMCDRKYTHAHNKINIIIYIKKKERNGKQISYIWRRNEKRGDARSKKYFFRFMKATFQTDQVENNILHNIEYTRSWLSFNEFIINSLPQFPFFYAFYTAVARKRSIPTGLSHQHSRNMIRHSLHAIFIYMLPIFCSSSYSIGHPLLASAAIVFHILINDSSKTPFPVSCWSHMKTLLLL